MIKPYQLFISYATEDEAFAKDLSNYLQYLGLRVWFAPLSLKVGEKLLDSINAGLLASEYGLLLLSPPYLAKRWTNYELEILHRQHIEDQKKIFPIWHGVDKLQVHNWNPGLSGIIALNSAEGFPVICEKIADVVYQGCPTRGISPGYENPQWRFLQGYGELYANKEDGGAFNLFEAAEFPDDSFPIYIHNKPHNRQEIILAVAKALYYGNPNVLPIAEETRNQMKRLCKSFGLDLDSPGFDPAIHG